MNSPYTARLLAINNALNAVTEARKMFDVATTHEEFVMVLNLEEAEGQLIRARAYWLEVADNEPVSPAPVTEF